MLRTTTCGSERSPYIVRVSGISEVHAATLFTDAFADNQTGNPPAHVTNSMRNSNGRSVTAVVYISRSSRSEEA